MNKAKRRADLNARMGAVIYSFLFVFIRGSSFRKSNAGQLFPVFRESQKTYSTGRFRELSCVRPKLMMIKTLLVVSVYVASLLLTFPQGVWGQDEYQFDLSEIEKEIAKKPYSLGGFFEFRPVAFGLDHDAAMYKLRFFDQDQEDVLKQYNLGLRLEGSYQKSIASLYFRTDSTLWHDYRGWDHDFVFQEGLLSLKPGPRHTVDLGKKTVQWGKGYAFNPVAFVARPKDPDNPTEALEGFGVITADLIRSFEGPLQTLAFTPVILPVTGGLNDDFGESNEIDFAINFAAKLYLLLWDTDIDFVFFTGESRTTRYGTDFARNITANFEIHGELALITGFAKQSIDTQGNLTAETSDVLQALAGLRYLTTGDITLIAEYYHNGGGIDAADAENFYTLADQAYDVFLADGDTSQLTRLSSKTIASVKPMRDYFYLRVSQKEPFDILYFTPALTSIVCLTDQSFSLVPEFIYSPKTDLEFRLRGTFLQGADNTEYGEKQNDYKAELRVRYYF